MSRTIMPPPGSLRYREAPVKSITRAPDGRFYLSRVGASTILIDQCELQEIEVL